MTTTTEHLADILALEPLEDNLFRGRSPPTTMPRIFGGLVVAQSLMAACRTAGDRLPHSLHAYFMLPGDPALPIVYSVERIRDGRSFTTRRVLAIQRGQAIFSLAASFHMDEPGLDHRAPMPVVPPPEDLAPDAPGRAAAIAGAPAAVRRYFSGGRVIELRPLSFDRYVAADGGAGPVGMWMRATSAMPDDPVLHRCGLAYASDMGLLDASLAPLGRTLFEPSIQAASLDHALWFHRPFRIDEWLLYTHDGLSLGGARGLGRGLVFARDGTLVASVVQEGLLRERPPTS